MPDQQGQQVEGQQTNEQQTPAPSVDAGAGFQVPEGKELVEAGFKDRASRWEQQAKGGQRWYETAKEFGIENPDSLKELGETFKTLRDRGVDPKALRSMFAEQQQEKPEGGQQFDPEHINKLIDERVTSTTATAEHKREAQSAQSLVKEYAGKLAPEGANDAVKKFIADAFQSRYQAAQSESLYPDGHPLSEKFLRPLGRDDIEKVFKQTSEDVKAILGGQSMSVAKSKPVSTPAGKRGTEGTSDDSDLTPAERARQAARARADAVLTRHKNSGQPTSAAG